MTNITKLSILSSFGLASTAFAGGSGSVSPYAYQLFEIGGLPVTNSMVTSWIVSISLILIVKAVVKTPKMIPDKGQIVVETFVDGLRDMVKPIVGAKMVNPTFWLLCGLFTFILINNWSGLFPGVGAFGFYDEKGNLDYWMRPGNADLNMTLALAIVAMLSWLFYIFKFAGPKTVFLDIFGNKADKKEIPTAIYYFLFVIFFAVGLIEVISIVFRPVSLSFRLFGNVFGGENLLVSMTNLIGYIVPVPFYFLEVLIGAVQAMVFTLLVAVYIGLICNHVDGEH
jgi:F-type H+-transporting ATPase subunit a